MRKALSRTDAQTRLERFLPLSSSSIPTPPSSSSLLFLLLFLLLLLLLLLISGIEESNVLSI